MSNKESTAAISSRLPPIEATIASNPLEPIAGNGPSLNQEKSSPVLRINGEVDRRRTVTTSGKPLQPIDPEKAIDAAAQLITTGKIPGSLGLSASEKDKVKLLVGMAPDEFYQELGGKMQSVLTKLIDRLDNEAEDISIGQVAVTFGIVSDKLEAALGRRSPTSVHIHNTQINGVTREQMIAELGQAANKKPH